MEVLLLNLKIYLIEKDSQKISILLRSSNFQNKTAFLTKGFSNFENLVDDIKADSRVLSFELDLIDPNLRTR